MTGHLQIQIIQSDPRCPLNPVPYMLSVDDLIIQYTASRNRHVNKIHPCRTPVFTSNSSVSCPSCVTLHACCHRNSILYKDIFVDTALSSQTLALRPQTEAVGNRQGVLLLHSVGEFPNRFSALPVKSYHIYRNTTKHLEIMDLDAVTHARPTYHNTDQASIIDKGK